MQALIIDLDGNWPRDARPGVPPEVRLAFPDHEDRLRGQSLTVRPSAPSFFWLMTGGGTMDGRRRSTVAALARRAARVTMREGLGPLMTDPVTPSPAATLVLLRDAAPGVELLLIQRHARSKFAAGDYVFAGGKVEPDDVPADAEQFCRGITAEQAVALLGGRLAPREALGYWIGAIREAFEEVGMLLAVGPDGRFVQFTPDNRERFAGHRAACQASNQAFFVMLRGEGLTLATDRLAYFAHWITPEENPIRFDTRFFAAVAPPGQAATADGREIVDVRWLTPSAALEALRRKEISLRTPTIKNLEIVDAAGRPDGRDGPGATGDEIVAALRGRAVPTIRPRILQVEGRPLAVLPGDPRWY
jgi:8-oxo-dGTP pyrophosphatase MutT (NUDIX family)